MKFAPVQYSCNYFEHIGDFEDTIIPNYPFTPVASFLRTLQNDALCSVHVASVTPEETYTLLFILVH